MVKITFDYPEQQKEFEQYVKDNAITENQIWHDGAVMRVFTGEDIPAQLQSE